MQLVVKSLYLKARSPGFKLHSYYTDFQAHPPAGWRVVAPGQTNNQAPGMLRQLHVVVQTSRAFWKLSNLIAPTLEKLAFPYTSRETPLEREASITYCSNHVQTKSEKWVADCEHIAALTGYYKPGVMSHWLGRRLQEYSCRGFYCWSNKAVENCQRILRGDFPTEKSNVVYPATSGAANTRGSRDFDGNVRVCHMTTHRSSHLENISNFYVKGTRDFLLLLKLISHVSPSLTRKMTVVIRAWCPESYIAKLRGLGVQIELIEHPLSRVEALSHLANSDLVMIPGHSTPTMAFIEAMSRGVPVIANDVWANSEYLIDGKTGFLIQPTSSVKYFDSDLTPLWYRPDFTRSLTAPVDPEYLRRHLRALEYLLEDENLLLSLKKETGRYFGTSPFELNSRNRKLGTLLDNASN